jgi:hypothetical protein
MDKARLFAALDETILNYTKALEACDAKLALLSNPLNAYFDGKESWSWSRIGGMEQSYGTASVENALKYIGTDIRIFNYRRGWAERVRGLASFVPPADKKGARRYASVIGNRLNLLYELSSYDVGKELDLSRLYLGSMARSVNEYLRGVPADAEITLVP